MPVEYPQVIAAINQWIGKNKISTDKGVTISGQPSARQKTALEFLIAFGIAYAIDSVFGTSTLPKDLKTGVDQVVKGVYTTVTNVGSDIYKALDIGSSVGQNPIEVPQVEAANATEAVKNLTVPTVSNTTAQSAWNNLVTKAEGLWKDVQTEWKSMVDSLSGVKTPAPDEHTLLSGLNEGSKYVGTVAEKIGIYGFNPADFIKSLSTLSTIGKGGQDYAGQITEKMTRVVELRAQPDQNDPAVTAEIIKLNQELEQLHSEIQTTVASDKTNMRISIAQSNALDAMGQSAQSISDYPDFKDTILATMQPDAAAGAQGLLTLREAGQTTPSPNTTVPVVGSKTA